MAKTKTLHLTDPVSKEDFLIVSGASYGKQARLVKALGIKTQTVNASREVGKKKIKSRTKQVYSKGDAIKMLVAIGYSEVDARGRPALAKRIVFL